MARKDYQIDEVLRSLSKKHDCRIDDRTNTIMVLKNKVHNKELKLVDNPKARFDLGNSSWGKIDFLVNHKDYTLVHVGQF